MSATILAIGDLTADHILGPLGELPRWGEEREVETLEIRLGGNTGNLALAGAALGLDVIAAGPIGDDRNGRFVAETLAARGLRTDHLRTYPDRGTSLTVALVRTDGERLFVTYPGALDQLADFIAITTLPAADLVIFSGWCQPPRIDPDTLIAACRRCRSAGAQIAIDLAWASESWADPEPVLRILAEMDLVLMNDDELRALTGLRTNDEALAFLTARLGSTAMLVVKCGAKGALLRDRGGPIVPVAATPLASSEAAVGAGDSFNAGLLHALLVQQSAPEEAVRFACDFAGYLLQHGRVERIDVDAIRAFGRA